MSSNVESETFRRELQRIEFRRALMSLPGGVGWLLHVARLFDFVESILGPGGFEMPDGLRIKMFQIGW